MVIMMTRTKTILMKSNADNHGISDNDNYIDDDNKDNDGDSNDNDRKRRC